MNRTNNWYKSQTGIINYKVDSIPKNLENSDLDRDGMTSNYTTLAIREMENRRRLLSFLRYPANLCQSTSPLLSL